MAENAKQETSSGAGTIASRNAEVEGVKLHYLTSGHGPVLILLHGYTQTSRMWKPIIPQLAEKFTVVAPDLPGIGDSDIPADGLDMKTAAIRIHALAKSLGVQKTRVVGHDIGLMVAYAYAAQFPTEMEKLALMDALLPGVAGWEEVYNNPRIWHFRFNGPTPEALVRGRERIYFDYFWNDFAADKTHSIPEEDRVAYEAAYARPGRMRAGWAYFVSFQQAAKDFAQLSQNKLPFPVLVIGGEKANGDVLAHQTKLVASNVTVVVLKDTGHWVLEERPRETNDALMKFLWRRRPGVAAPATGANETKERKGWFGQMQDGKRACAFPLVCAMVLATFSLLPVAASRDVGNAAPTLDAGVAVGAQYDSTHVCVAPGDRDAFVNSFATTFGGQPSPRSVTNVLPVASSTEFQYLWTSVGTLSVFAFRTPIPFPFGQERTGYLVTDMDQAVKAARSAGAEVIVEPFKDPIGMDAVIQWPGGVKMQLYWHFTPPKYAPLETIPDNRVYLSRDQADNFVRDFVRFSRGKVIEDDKHADGGGIGRTGETYRRIRITSLFGNMQVLVTDGHLPYPFGHEVTGYQVQKLDATLEKAKAAGAKVLSAPYTTDGRTSAIVEFPGGYIAEVHSLVAR